MSNYFGYSKPKLGQMSKPTEEKSSLFVAEDDDMYAGSESDDSHGQFHEAYEEQPQEDDDPVIDSIPIIMNELPNRSKQSLHVLQYTGRPKTRPFTNDHLKTSVKQESNFLEVKVPLDTTKFYDESRSEEWGAQVAEHSLQGVLNETDGGLYVGQIISNGDKKKLVLVPIDSTTQLRPSFKYLDDVEAAKIVQRRADNMESQKSSNIQILQTSAKSGSSINNGDGFGTNALGESLRHIKKFEEEEWSHLTWKGTDNEKTQEIKKHLADGANDIELTTKTTIDEYIDMLTHA